MSSHATTTDVALTDRTMWHDLPPSYLYTGAHAPALRAVTSAVAEAVQLQSNGSSGRVELLEIEQRGQCAVAEAAGCGADDVAFVGDASTAWNMIAGGLEWQPGDNVVINDLEHPSVAFPFMRLAAFGLEVRVVRRTDRWLIEPEALANHLDAKTRAIALSHVSYVNGARHDIAAISRLADSARVPLFVDWTHSLGVLPVDNSLCSIGVSASYKWALGPYGVGIVMWNRERLPTFTPGSVGWRSTPDFFCDDRFAAIHLDQTGRRFRLGAASFAGIAGLTAGLTHLRELSRVQVAKNALSLSGEAGRMLAEAGFDVITPPNERDRAGSVAIRHPLALNAADALSRDGILVWAGDGRLRASFHVMNSHNDVVGLVTALRAWSEGIEQ